MDQTLPDLYSTYGKYINEFRSFPSVLDGCKIVERRLLYSLYLVARDSKQKAAKVVGHCIGSFHPHGDLGTYSALVTLAQNDFIEKQGNWGTNVGIEPCPAAAQRYTECKSSKEILDLAFEYINDVPMDARELDKEPIFIPTRLPICLLGNEYCQGIGFGYRTLIPCYEKKDLLKRLSWLLGYEKKEPIIKPKSDCDILSSNADLKLILTTGRGKLEFKGRYTTDIKNNSVVIHSIPPGKTFISILKKFSKEIEVEKSLGYIDESTKSTNVRLKILKPRSLNLTTLIKKVEQQLTGSMTFECNMVNVSGKVVLVPVDQMLSSIHQLYQKVVLGVLKSEVVDLDEKISELNIIGKMRPHLSKELKDNPDDIEKVVNNISNQLKVDLEVIKSIFGKNTISKLFKVKTDTADLSTFRNKKINDINSIADYVWKEKYKEGTK
jgi:DNA gyrase/topoisomerase IV subunit A